MEKMYYSCLDERAEEKLIFILVLYLYIIYIIIYIIYKVFFNLHDLPLFFYKMY